MAEEIQIKIGVNANEANQTVGQLKNNLEGLDGAQKKANDSSTKLNQNLKNTSNSIKNLGVEGASRGIEKMASGFSNLKLSSIAGGFRMVGAAIASNPIGAIATAVLALVNAFGGLDVIMGAITSAAKNLLGPLGSLFGATQDMEGAQKAFDDELERSNGLLAQQQRELAGVKFQLQQNEQAIQNEINLLKAQGATEEEIAKKTEELYRQKVKNSVDIVFKTKEQLQALTGLNDEATDNDLKRAFERRTAEMAALQFDEDKKAKFIEDRQKQLDELFTTIAQARANRDQAGADLEIFRAQRVTDAKNKAIKEQEKANNTAAINKSKTDKETERAEREREQFRKETTANIIKRLNEESKAIEEKNNKELDTKKQQLIEGLISEETFAAEKVLLEKKSNDEILQLRQNFQLTELELFFVGKENEKQILQKNSEEVIKLQRENVDIELGIIKKNNQEKITQTAQDEKDRIETFEREWLQKKIDLLNVEGLTEEELAEKIKQLEVDKAKAKLETLQVGSAEYLALQEEITEKEIDINEKKNKKIEDDNKKRQEQLKAGFEAAINVGNQALGAFSALADAQLAIRTKGLEKGSVEEQKAAKRDFETRKKISIASAVISGIEGIVNVWTAKSVLPIELATIYKGIQSAFIIATTAANIAKIKATTFQGTTPPTQEPPPSGGGGGNGGEAPTFTPTSFFGLGQTTQFNPQEQGPTRVYVTEGDISNTQNRVRVVENRARFG